MHPVNGDDGYTLVELLLVILLLAIVTAGAVAVYSDVVAQLKLDTAAREIQEALQYARNQSISSDVDTSSAFGVSFLAPRSGADNGNWFQGVQKNGILPLTPLTHPVSKKSYKIDFDDPGYFQGIIITGVTLDSNGQAFFDRRGTPSVAGSVTIQYGDEQRTISLGRFTGAVTVN